MDLYYENCLNTIMKGVDNDKIYNIKEYFLMIYKKGDVYQYIKSGSRHYRPTPSSAYGIIHLGPIFATRKVLAPFSNIQSSWADQYGSIDT